MTVMLYKYPGIHDIHDDKFDYIVVDEVDVRKALDDGWFLTTDEAKNHEDVTNKSDDLQDEVQDYTPPTREEIRQKADELGIQYSPNIGDKKLLERIEEKLEEKL